MSPFQQGFMGGFIVGGLVLFVISSILWIHILNKRGAL